MAADRNDRGLAERFAREEPGAIAEVRGWVEGMVRGGWRLADADAAVQDIMLELTVTMRARRGPLPERFRSFVLTIARHTCIDLHRREMIRTTDELPPRLPDANPSSNPEARLLARQKREIARAILRSLTSECRELLALVFREGLGAKAAAARLGLTAGNVRVKTHRCLKAARALSADWDVEHATGAGRPDDNARERGPYS